jgi:hypothetical protein
MKARLIRSDGSSDVIDLPGDPSAVKRVLSADDLAEKRIWKYSRPMGTVVRTEAVAIADRNGYEKGLPPNAVASRVLARLGVPVQYVTGPVILCGVRSGVYIDCPPSLLRDSGRYARSRPLSSPFAKGVLGALAGLSVLAIIGGVMSAHAGSATDRYGYPKASHEDGVSALEQVGLSQGQAECVQTYMEQQMSYSDWVSFRKTSGYQSWTQKNGQVALSSCG